MSLIPLTERQQWAVTIALELEQAGWLAAAHYLRQKYFPTLAWNDPKVLACTHRGWEELFRIHHGSLPPWQPHSHVSSQVITPTIRPDQTIA